MGWDLTKSPQAPVGDLVDPVTGLKFQSKVFDTPVGSLNALHDWWDNRVMEKVPPNARNYYLGRMRANQIEDLVRAGKLKAGELVPESTRAGVRLQQTYYDPSKPEMKITALRAEPETKNYYANAAKARSIENALGQRPAGFGSGAAIGFVVGSTASLAAQVYQGQPVDWIAVGESGGLGFGGGAATVLLAQQLEQRFGKELARIVVARNLLPALGRATLSGAAASTVVGGIAVIGFVAKDYFTDQITFNEAVVQTGIGLGSVGAGVGAGIILTWATAGTVAGSELPGIGNVVGFVGGLAAGTVAYLGGEWYYQTFKLEGIMAERREFAKNAAVWNAEKLNREIRNFSDTAAILRAQAARTLQQHF